LAHPVQCATYSTTLKCILVYKANRRKLCYVVKKYKEASKLLIFSFVRNADENRRISR